MSKKYEFLDKKVDFRTAVINAKNILNKELSNIEKAKTLKITLR